MILFQGFASKQGYNIVTDENKVVKTLDFILFPNYNQKHFG